MKKTAHCAAYALALGAVSSMAEGPRIQPLPASPQRRAGLSSGAQPIWVPYTGPPPRGVPYIERSRRSWPGPCLRRRVRMARVFRAPSHCSPHSVHLPASPRKEAALVPAMLVQRSSFQSTRAFPAPVYVSTRHGSGSRSSTEQRPHDASLLASLQEETVLLPTLLLQKSRAQETWAFRAPGHDSTRHNSVRFPSMA